MLSLPDISLKKKSTGKRSMNCQYSGRIPLEIFLLTI